MSKYCEVSSKNDKSEFLETATELRKLIFDGRSCTPLVRNFEFNCWWKSDFQVLNIFIAVSCNLFYNKYQHKTASKIEKKYFYFIFKYSAESFAPPKFEVSHIDRNQFLGPSIS